MPRPYCIRKTTNILWYAPTQRIAVTSSPLLFAVFV